MAIVAPKNANQERQFPKLASFALSSSIFSNSSWKSPRVPNQKIVSCRRMPNTGSWHPCQPSKHGGCTCATGQAQRTDLSHAASVVRTQSSNRPWTPSSNPH